MVSWVRDRDLNLRRRARPQEAKKAPRNLDKGGGTMADIQPAPQLPPSTPNGRLSAVTVDDKVIVRIEGVFSKTLDITLSGQEALGFGVDVVHQGYSLMKKAAAAAAEPNPTKST